MFKAYSVKTIITVISLDYVIIDMYSYLKIDWQVKSEIANSPSMLDALLLYISPITGMAHCQAGLNQNSSGYPASYLCYS